MHKRTHAVQQSRGGRRFAPPDNTLREGGEMVVKAKCVQCGKAVKHGDTVTPVCESLTVGEVMGNRLSIRPSLSGVICEPCRKKVMKAAMREMR